ncbi:MAG: hypothetical protein HY432_03575 [Candidatus Liptonbacteria bacterium]|nr:hypothetical protein [Candidatus Liptonbacteria bacterium]
MEAILKFFFYLVVWFFVPIVLLLIIRFLATVHTRTNTKSQKHAAHAGFWAGFVLFIIVMIYQINIFLQIGFPNNYMYNGFNLWLCLIAALIIFVVATPTVMSNWTVLILTFLSFFALFHYLFVRTYNDIILSIVMGMVFGFLTHIAASLSPAGEFLKKKDFTEN